MSGVARELHYLSCEEETAMEKKLFTIRECGKGPTVAGLEGIEASNSALMMLATDKPIDALLVGEFTVGRSRKDAVEVVRIA